MKERQELKNLRTCDGLDFFENVSILIHRMLFLLDGYCADADRIVANVIANAGLDPELFIICPDQNDGGIDVLSALTDISMDAGSGREIPVLKYEAEIDDTVYTATAFALSTNDGDTVSVDMRVVLMSDNGKTRMINNGDGWKPVLF
jgi:hypothetical protein